ncbi:MAG: 5-formyltetrahydrofolate cyclo-ligase [Alphaproteobacteria bacterium]|nr:MAG: 5-formyltetrahydrofolate cyclo-ligase [Alphaproteobacteria bacterium]
MTGLKQAKIAARRQAREQRAAAHAQAMLLGRWATAHLVELFRLRPECEVIAGYLPIRSEIDPVPAMTRLHREGRRICAPVVGDRDAPLSFRLWQPGCRLVEGAFGAPIPAEGETVRPDALIVPMLAFDDRRFRLGYGGGFYDRTIAMLRDTGGVLAVGFAYAAQRMAELPVEATDMALDAIVTEKGVLG